MKEEMTMWRDEARAVGRLDSEGQFTLDPRHAWNKLIQGTDPEACFIRVIQAAVRAAMRKFWAGAPPTGFKGSPELEVDDLPGRLRLGGRYALASPAALARALEAGAPPSEPVLHHLWIAVLAGLSQPQVRALEFVACDGQQRERLQIRPSVSGGLPELQLTTQPEASSPSWSWEILTTEKPRGLSRLLARWKTPGGSGFSPDVRILQEVDFAAAPLAWSGEHMMPGGLLKLIPRRACLTKDTPIWQTLAESYDLAEPGDEDVLTVGWDSLHRSYQLDGVRMPEWYQRWESEGMAPPHMAGPGPWRSVYCDLSGQAPSRTMIFACGCQFLCRRAVFLPLLPLPREGAGSDEEEGVLDVMQDGTLLTSYRLPLPYPRAHVFVTAQGLRTDLSSGKVVQDEVWERCVRGAYREGREASGARFRGACRAADPGPLRA